MWMTWILQNWKLILLGLVIALVGFLSLRLQTVTAQRDAKIAEIDFMAKEAETFRSNSERIARQTNDEIPKLVEQARKTAYANYLKKFGNNAACGITGRLSDLPTGLSEADSAERTNASTANDVLDPVRELAEQCGETTVMVTEFQRWVRLNDLPVKQ
jgi:hypothetical protein